ncbi:hypothetical protein MHY85_05225 [Cellulomonas sp. ACRRI]|uniref:hypothetical protein n=1 Tax=Cellulomonas sp. ACRRI TaxID=2918188 RepID=UPI001EF34659|nr:hypothetical protein [Cellulomonas sp. ACRRI]MCG7285377.1 hypothetical protein [Cellulomonas sp. ACRRI]
MSAPIEVTTKYATSVDELADAWAFVMARLDAVGPDPRITISPIWTYSSDEISNPGYRAPRRFEVCVEGMVHESEARA